MKPIWLLAALPAVAITFAAIAQDAPTNSPTTAPAKVEPVPETANPLPPPPDERGPRGFREDRGPGPREGPRDGPRDGMRGEGPFERGPGGPGGGPDGPRGPGGMDGGPGGLPGGGPGGPGGMMNRRAPSADTMRNYLELVDRYAQMSKDPTSAGVAAVITAADLLRARGPEAAITFFEKLLPDVTDPAIARAIHLQLAELYKANGKTDKALEQLSEVIKGKKAE